MLDFGNCSPDGDNVVDLLRLAQQLQMDGLFSETTDLVLASITPSNVTSILQLGEELNHSKLFSAALDFLVKEIEDFESSDGWDAIDQGVRDKVITLRNLSRSSLIGRGAKVSEVVFASAGEFVAMLEETIQDQSERLLDAKQRQQELRDCIIGRSGNRIGYAMLKRKLPNRRRGY